MQNGARGIGLLNTVFIEKKRIFCQFKVPKPSNELIRASMAWPEPRIYIVDDDPVFTKFIENHIRSNGFTNLRTFDSGESFIESLKGNPDIVLLDFSLKGINGMDVLKQIGGVGSSTKVVVITVINDKELEAKCLENGATDYLVKEESRMDALKARVLDILQETKKSKRRRGIIAGISFIVFLALLYFIYSLMK